MFVVTKEYFSFKKITTIDVKDSTIDDNYPVITLEFKYRLEYLFYYSFDNLDKFANNQKYPKFDKSKYFQLEQDLTYKFRKNNVSVNELLTEILVDFYNYSENILLNRKIIERLKNNTGLRLISHNGNEIMSKIVSKPILGWFVSNLGQYSDYLSITVTFKINFENSDKKKGMNFLNVFHRINKTQNFWNFKEEYVKKILVHSQPIPHFYELSSSMTESKPISENYTLILSKTLRTYLEPPFGDCSYYSPNSDQPFNASSYMQCYRLCIKDLIEKQFNCVPLFIEDSISEMDFPTNNKTLCPFKTLTDLDFTLKKKQRLSKCNNYCPKDCLTLDFDSNLVKSDTKIGNEFWYNLNESERYYRKSLIWDSTQPMFAYNEAPVMSFTDYLVDCGGLIGLYLGTNAKDFMIWLIETQFWIKLWLKIKEYLGLRTAVVEISINQ